MSYNGFMWADFVLDPAQTDVIYHPGKKEIYIYIYITIYKYIYADFVLDPAQTDVIYHPGNK